MELDPLATAPRLFDAYEELLRAHNEKLGLVSEAAMESFSSGLLAPSVALANLPCLAPATRIVDLGSGNGLPGIPVAITHPAADTLLVDSQLKRCRFLEEVVAALELPHVRVLHARVEKVRTEPAPDVFISWFFKDLRMTAAWTRRWRKPGTRYLMIAGEDQLAPSSVYDLALLNRHPLGAGKVAFEYLAQ